jgi:hypothetical protein
VFDLETYLREVARMLALFLHGSKWTDKHMNQDTIYHITMDLGYLLVLGEEHLEPSMMATIWEALAPEDRSFLKARFIKSYCYSNFQRER